MKSISTTQLRTKSKELVHALHDGQVVELIHRSAPVGEIRPKTKQVKTLTKERIEKLNKLIDGLRLSPTTPAEREKRYRAHLEKKYG